MSDQRYQPGIILGIKLHGGQMGLFYLNQPSRWPELPGVGSRHCGAFSRCTGCGGAWTFVRYGTQPTCLDCALDMARMAA